MIGELVFAALWLFLACGVYYTVRAGIEAMFDVRPGDAPSSARSDACQPQAQSPLRLAGTPPHNHH